jgi:hypothetical protein
MNLNTSLTALFALSLPTLAFAETTAETKTPVTTENSFFDTLAEKQLTLSIGSQNNKVEDFASLGDLDLSGIYFSASLMPIENFKLSAGYFTTESDPYAETSLVELYNELYYQSGNTVDGDAILETFGLDYYADGWGATYSEDGSYERSFANGYQVSTSLEMNEFEIGAAYVLNISNSLSANIYLGYISGELVVNEKLSTKLIFTDDYSDVPSTLQSYINNNPSTYEGLIPNTEEQVIQQSYSTEYGYSYSVYPDDNLNARDVSTSIDYTAFVMKLEADIAVTNNFHLLAGIASESTDIETDNETYQDTVYNLGASVTIWQGVGVEFNHKIYDGQSKTSVGLNYKF